MEEPRLALRRDGTVVEVGNGYNNPVYGTAEAVARLRDVVAIAAGYGHSLALRHDGSVVGWGRNDFGQANMPSDLGDVTAIAAGSFHSLALRRDGSVASWDRAPAGRERALAGHEVLAIAAGLGFDLAVVRAQPPV